MGRPREHDQKTAASLLEAAERIVETEGVHALSVRRVADEVGTTTRAVYSLFGSKDGVVSALGARAFVLLGKRVAALPKTQDPVVDLVEAGARGFRGFAIGHPALFRIAVQRTDVAPPLAASFRDAAIDAMAHLHARIERVALAPGIGDRTIPDAAWQFHALCEGLAALELRFTLDRHNAQRLWRDALRSLVVGWTRP